MADKAKYIQMAVASGITDLSGIHRAYETYADGGYLDWIDAVKKWKPGIDEDIDSDNPSYDYEGFYMEDPDRAWEMLKEDSEAHFTDRYKKPNHPTFSDESIYSTPETPGGHWHENYGGSGRYVYEPSDYTKKNRKETMDYLRNSGEGYLDGMNAVFPSTFNVYAEGGTTVRDAKTGKDVHFDTRQEADDYISANYSDPNFHLGELPGITVTAKKPRSIWEQGASNFEETFGVTPRDAAGFVPYVGDALDVKDIGDNLSEGKYMEAGLGAGMLLLPNIIEKPLKAARRGIKKFINGEFSEYLYDIRHLPETTKAIREGRYAPLMSRKKKREYLEAIHRGVDDEVIPFVEDVVSNSVAYGNFERTREDLLRIAEGRPLFGLSSDYAELMPKDYFPRSRYPKWKITNKPNNWGYINVIKHKDDTRTFKGIGLTPQIYRKVPGTATPRKTHFYRSVDEVLGGAAHEYGHLFNHTRPATKRVIVQRPTNGIFEGPDLTHFSKEDLDLFEPFLRRIKKDERNAVTEHEWESHIDELLAEVYRHKWNHRNSQPITADYPNLDEISKEISDRFLINDVDATRQMLIGIAKRGYRYGGQLGGINSIANTFDDGGLLSGLKEFYYKNILDTPEYSSTVYPTLRSAIEAGYDNDLKGQDILYDGKPIKVLLNSEDEANYYRKKELLGMTPEELKKEQMRFIFSPDPVFLAYPGLYNQLFPKKTKEDYINEEFSKYRTSPNDSWESAKAYAAENGWIDYMYSQARAIQKNRVLNALHQDPRSTGRGSISLKDTYSKDIERSPYNLTLYRYDPDLIDLIAKNLKKGEDIYTALTLPIHETGIGYKTNLPVEQGTVRAMINDHNYELGTSYFNELAQYVRNSAPRYTPRKSGETDIAYRRRIENLVKEATGDLYTFKENYPEIYTAMEEDASNQFNEENWNKYNSEYTSMSTPYIRHALDLYMSGNYNNGNKERYSADTAKFTEVLKRSKELKKYLESQGYI